LSADELFALARDKSEQGRRALFDTVSDLFLEDGRSLSDRERALMGEILRHLIHDVEMTVRKALAERLAVRADTPRSLVLELANDEIEVAHDILLESKVLQDADLVEVIKHRTMEHQLAVSMRNSVSEQVSKALVETGQEDVITSLLNNHGARVSREVMEYLVSESKRVDAYQNPLVERPDLSPDLAQRMYWWVSAAIKKHIADRFSIDQASLDDAVEAAATQNMDQQLETVATTTKSEELVDRLDDLGELDADFLIKSLRQGEVSLFEAGFGKMSGLRPKLLRRILFESGGEALALLCRAIDIDADTFLTVYALTRRAKDGEQEIDSQQRADLEKLYRMTDPGDAERVLKRWRRSSAYLYAQRQVAEDG
jgi:uncharacterized protein (DUF2336 family)